MRKILCDSCGDEIRGEAGVNYIALYKTNPYRTVDHQEPEKVWEVCNGCKSRVSRSLELVVESR